MSFIHANQMCLNRLMNRSETFETFTTEERVKYVRSRCELILRSPWFKEDLTEEAGSVVSARAIECIQDMPFLLSVIEKQSKALGQAKKSLKRIVGEVMGEPHHAHSDKDLVDMLSHINLHLRVEAKECLVAMDKILNEKEPDSK